MARIVVLLFSVCFWATDIVAQERSVAKIKSAYLFRFAENTTWPNESDFKAFGIGVFGNADDIIAELTVIKRAYKLKGLPIELKQIKSLEDMSQVRLIYMTNPKCFSINSVLKKALEENILVVSDQCEGFNAKMIEFVYSSDHKIQFEINTAHIKNAGLVINPKLLLLGGEESEALEVLIESEKSLNTEKKRADQLKNQLSTLEAEWQKEKIKYDKQALLIAKQAEKLKDQKDEMNVLSDSITHQQARYDEMKASIGEQSVTIKNQQKILEEKLKEIEVQSQAFEKNSRLLEKQADKLENQVKLIDEHEQLLDKQVSIIQWQKYGLILAIILIAITLIFVGSIVRNSRIKRRAFALLEKKNLELKSQRQELMEMTEALRHKSEQLQASMEEVENANTEIRKINENLEETVRLRTEELREQHEKILNYLSHNSHIVRGPLSRILGLTNIFESLKPEETGQILGDLTRAAQEVDKVVIEINQVLESEREKFDR